MNKEPTMGDLQQALARETGRSVDELRSFYEQYLDGDCLMTNATYRVSEHYPQLAYLVDDDDDPNHTPLIRRDDGIVMIKDASFGPFPDFQSAANFLAAVNKLYDAHR